jgi:uncharacterized circularly permuted ATP-grasp superfamily protein
LKTIDQLERVDVIIKRIDDQWCDPLELNKSSLLGSGLLQVMRLGNVSVINSRYFSFRKPWTNGLYSERL